MWTRSATRGDGYAVFRLDRFRARDRSPRIRAHLFSHKYRVDSAACFLISDRRGRWSTGGPGNSARWEGLENRTTGRPTTGFLDVGRSKRSRWAKSSIALGTPYVLSDGGGGGSSGFGSIAGGEKSPGGGGEPEANLSSAKIFCHRSRRRKRRPTGGGSLSRAWRGWGCGAEVVSGLAGCIHVEARDPATLDSRGIYRRGDRSP